MERLDIQDYIKPLLKWWWLLLIATVLAALASYFYTVRQPDVYTSQASLMVGSVLGQTDPDQNSFYVPVALAETYADIGMRNSVRQATMEALDMNWLPFYWIESVPNAPVIEIVVSSEIPELSQTVAAELANQLILQGPSGQEAAGSQQFIASRLAKLQSDIQTTEVDIEQKRAKLGDLFSAREIAAVNDEIAALEVKLGSLNDQYIDLLSQTTIEAPNTITVIGQASFPTLPDSSNLWLNVILAAAVGLVLSSGGAYLLEYLDDTVKTSEGIKKQFGLSTLSAIPAIVESKANVLSGNVAVDDSKLIMLSSPHSPHAEAFRILRTNLQFAEVNRRFKNVLITSPEPGDGKSTVIANLGMALAQAGKRVVIIDADLHRPTLHQVFQVPNNVGVTTALFGSISNVTQMLHQTRTPGLRILTSGPLPPNPSELLGSDLMETMLNVLEQEADIILLDTPPATILVDAASLSVHADAVVLVVRANKTSRTTAKHAVEALRQVRANIAGVVINGVSIQNTGYHYNYSQYGYNRYSQAAPTGRPFSQPPVPKQPMTPRATTRMSPNGSQPSTTRAPEQHPKGRRGSQSGRVDPGLRPASMPNQDRAQRTNSLASPSAGARPHSPYVQRTSRTSPPDMNSSIVHRPENGQTSIQPLNGANPASNTYNGSDGPPYGYGTSPQSTAAPNSNGYTVDPRIGVSVDSYGRVPIPQEEPAPKKGLGRFWRS